MAYKVLNSPLLVFFSPFYSSFKFFTNHFSSHIMLSMLVLVLLPHFDTEARLLLLTGFPSVHLLVHLTVSLLWSLVVVLCLSIGVCELVLVVYVTFSLVCRNTNKDKWIR